MGAYCLDCDMPLLDERGVPADVCPACRHARIRDALLEVAWGKWCEKGEEEPQSMSENERCDAEE